MHQTLLQIANATALAAVVVHLAHRAYIKGQTRQREKFLRMVKALALFGVMSVSDARNLRAMAAASGFHRSALLDFALLHLLGATFAAMVIGGAAQWCGQ